jgi:predicted ABC-type exoprotein transport system permease subunit
MTLIELLAFLLLCFLAFLLGDYGSKYAGWLAWAPAFALAVIAMWIAVASLVAEVRGQIVAIRKRLRKSD